MQDTSIGWTNRSANPIRARNRKTGRKGWYCVRLGPECDLCYAANINRRFGTGVEYLARHADDVELYLDRRALRAVLRSNPAKPFRLFWVDMADLFLDQVPFAWVDEVVAVMAMTPWVTHQVLTKRSRRMLDYFTGDYVARVLAVLDRWDPEAYGPEPVANGQRMRSRLGNQHRAHLRWPLPLAWCGMSVGVQRSVYRVEHLRRTPVALRFISGEPLLEDVTFPSLDGIHWLIIGGESGSGARPCQTAWVRHLRQQAEDAGVAVFLKQLGSRPVGQEGKEVVTTNRDGGAEVEVRYAHVRPRKGVKDFERRYELQVTGKGEDQNEWPEDMRCARARPTAQTSPRSPPPRGRCDTMQEVKYARGSKQGLYTAASKTVSRHAEGGTTFMNRGAAGTTTFILPADAEAGDAFKFVRVAAQNLRVDPGTDAIRNAVGAGAHTLQTADKYVELAAGRVGATATVYSEAENRTFYARTTTKEGKRVRSREFKPLLARCPRRRARRWSPGLSVRPRPSDHVRCPDRPEPHPGRPHALSCPVRVISG